MLWHRVRYLPAERLLTKKLLVRPGIVEQSWNTPLKVWKFWLYWRRMWDVQRWHRGRTVSRKEHAEEQVDTSEVTCSVLWELQNKMCFWSLEGEFPSPFLSVGQDLRAAAAAAEKGGEILPGRARLYTEPRARELHDREPTAAIKERCLVMQCILHSPRRLQEQWP